MDSQELIHLHALLHEVREQLEADHEIPADTFEPYEKQPVRPLHVHRRKDAHQRAVFHLLEGIRAVIQPSPTAVRPAT
ncbi:UPF0058 family protein [Natrononativus amylolyticus]|uniref:UPF0058 family protein n=1 Tax=Natrononativus amylolyticus TaxID=2963434 RepID=UPI0020CB71A5|nr:UPF0058 family protein [Natrononativus amylolyticus]